MALVGSLSGSLGLIAVTGSFVPSGSNLYSIGTSTNRWSNVVSTAFSGSLTKLADGTTDYLIGGSNITLTTGANGSVTIAATSTATTPGGADRNVQFNNAGAFDGDDEFSWSGTVLAVTGSVSASQGITGSDVFAKSLTSGRVVYAGAGGKLIDSSEMTFTAGTGLTLTKDLSARSGSFSGDVVVTGDLTVNGTTTTISSSNLVIKDPLILIASSSTPGVRNGGIAILSGSTAGTDLVIGRCGGDIWGVGEYDTQNGTDYNTFNMSMVPMRALQFEVKSGTGVGTTNTILKSSGDTLIASGSVVALSGSSIDFVKDGTRFAYVGVSTDVSPLDGLFPSTDNLYNLGSPALRWQNIYTGDLHLRNERGDYTLIEEEDFLSIRFNKTGKRYKFVLEPVPELDEK